MKKIRNLIVEIQGDETMQAAQLKRQKLMASLRTVWILRIIRMQSF